MPWTLLTLDVQSLPGAMPAWRAELPLARLRAICIALRDQGARLVSLWGSDERDHGAGFVLHLAFAGAPGLLWLRIPLAEVDPSYPDLSDLFPVAERLQRAVRDLLGLNTNGANDARPWLRHGAWREGDFPLRRDYAGPVSSNVDSYPFVTVTGEGVHEIAVGPVHAGTIEPGHFRFQVVGEKILRLEERFGYTHKGIQKRFAGLDIATGAKLVGRVSGDSTVAYAWAYAQAIESAAGVAVPERAAWLRGLCLERERVANHLGDLGALGNDAGLAFGLAQFSRLKEDVLRMNEVLFGHRYLMDAIVPGGVARDLAPEGVAPLYGHMQKLRKELDVLQEIYLEHAGVQDRFLGAGELTPALAGRLGVIGLAGRASGQAYDLRVQHPCAPYMDIVVALVTRNYGDVAARVTVRFEEIRESLRVCERLLHRLPTGDVRASLPAAPVGALGIGWVEGWRGEVLIALEVGEGERLRFAQAHDPSWQNWPALEHAVIGNIVPDFPLINKSFNLSYSGHDL